MIPLGILQQQNANSIILVGTSLITGISYGPDELIINKPPGTQEGDLVIMIEMHRNLFTSLPSDSGAAWVEDLAYDVFTASVATPVTGNDSNYVWHKVANASEPAQYGIPFVDDGTEGMSALCMTFRNVNTVGSYGVISSNVAPSVTAALGDTLISWHGTVYNVNSESGVLAPAGMSLINKEWNTNTGVGLAVAYQSKLGAGASGAKTWTSNWTSFEISGNILIGPLI